MFAAKFFCSHSHIILATRHVERACENIYRAQNMSAFYSSWTCCSILSCYSPHLQNLSFHYELFSFLTAMRRICHRLWFREIRLNIIEKRLETVSKHMFYLLRIDLPFRIWLCPKNARVLHFRSYWPETEDVPFTSQFKKIANWAAGELNLILEEHHAFDLQVIFSSENPRHQGIPED